MSNDQHLLPPSATPSEIALSLATSRIGMSSADPGIDKLWDPWNCASSLLPWLAWAVSVDEWDSSWPEAIKRQVIADSLALHRHDGTRWALERALIMTGFPQAKLTEWFEYGGDPFYFRVAIDLLDTGIDEAVWQKLDDRLNRYKNARSWLDRLELWLSARGSANYALNCSGSELLTVWPWSASTIELSGASYHGMAQQSVERLTVYPQII